ncbi:ferrous iron transport protein B [Clostridium sp. D2Q-11]|uniref:Ferrous iron transport protein B n=1 Tax=Anaeromonas frigoriresistens TaxID=2683708 RepID=A0A942Z6R6_9FIRM|nr:ferrous iron transport protein B [Anaeromonas frigoriresistens]MBS4538761.1 ferrous iron transport protein B [Anaeromonas frigoriresistens]
MGLTNQSTGTGALKEMFEVELESLEDIVVALAGNPNTGKSTVFNSLTGLNQHTGNWPGKTVTNAQGKYKYNSKRYILVDLPGTYSLLANSAEEQVARDFVCFGNPHATVVVTDATCLERNLNLVLQILEITNKVVVCVNLMDEAKRKKINVDLKKLSEILGVPVVGTTARSGQGLDKLKDTVQKVAKGEIETNPIKIKYNKIFEDAIEDIKEYLDNTVEDKINTHWTSLRLIDGDQPLLDSMNEYLNIDLSKDELLKQKLESVHANLYKESIRDHIVSCIVKTAEGISKKTVLTEKKKHNEIDRKFDNVLTSRIFGLPIMIALLGIIFWLTIQGANYPSAMLAQGLFWIEGQLTIFFNWLGTPTWIHDILILGMYRTLAWVVSVMLPPMAIFFPIFTLLEDLGYLPRVAFNLDHYFKKACAHGKQALTMCMGFGCNAAGIIACRIIDSPRERLIAIITNNFVPCNGRFPTLIALATIFIASGAGAFNSVAATLSILITIILGVFITLMISKILSKTILKGLPSSFTLELPPYRKPQVGRVIVRSIFDRTLFVLGRAVAVAAPAGLVIWVMANIAVGNVSILTHCAQFLDPFANLLGLDGYILMAFILGLPANEIVIPILIMSYMSKGSMLELDSLSEMRQLFVDNGWTWLTAVCTMLFSLNHWPCGTTLWTIRKETQSLKWTWVSFIIPTITGIVVCFIVAQGARLLGLVL